MIHDTFRSIFFGALALVTVSGCAVGTSTVDVSATDDEQELPSTAAAPEGDDDHEGRTSEARPSTIPVPCAEAIRAGAREPNGPYPLPWSSRPD